MKRKPPHRYPRQPSIDNRLASVALEVLDGKPIDCPWKLFLLAHFPGWKDEDAAEAIAHWRDRVGVSVDYQFRKVVAAGRVLQVIYIVITKRPSASSP